ncbi:unnamed protein product [Cuscuta epithymum]|uniref:Uncharacterized protein n=1 Tax=Cuscuta epithymum TaxID=186058 RepID=A0AAV0FIZ2_9ASTE|nr:unnamed protein product [Cuscuta epithymum]
MEMKSSMRKPASFFTLAAMVALISLSLAMPVMSTIGYGSYSPPTPAGDDHDNIDCNTPPHGGSGSSGSHHDSPTPSHHDSPTPSKSTPSKSPPSDHHGSSGGGGGYSHSPPPYTPTPVTPVPVTPTPKTPTPTTPIIVSPPIDPGTPTYITPTPTIPTPSSPISHVPTTPTVGLTPPIPFIPYTPPSVGTPPFTFNPSSPGPFPCTFWRAHPTMIWGLVGWNGNSVRSMFGMGSGTGAGEFGAGMSCLEALSNTRTDGLGELYREGTAAMLNALSSGRSFPYTADQVKVSFGRAALSSSDSAAAAQANLFKLANEGHLKPAARR